MAQVWGRRKRGHMRDYGRHLTLNPRRPEMVDYFDVQLVRPGPRRGGLERM